MQPRVFIVLTCLGSLSLHPLFVADSPAQPSGVSDSNQLSVTVTNKQLRMQWVPYPSAQQYEVLSSLKAGTTFTNDGAGSISGNTFIKSNTAWSEFFRLGIRPTC
ncbi:MAG: hypothetical protein DME25_12910 [Verrucomicrobia bacterium]|nr:MAG: hypothetical protein DME25_12910 [Verrucomicrobiota bacterium]